ncbi:VanZ family protein [Haliea sp. E17]|uniref:VanZ family protein n=1 Tax=Haliea sp. E17 TaxID=3401576 RepID=UPI003AB011C3
MQSALLFPVPPAGWLAVIVLAARISFILYTLLIAYLSLRPMDSISLGSWDKLYHFLAYGLFAVLGYYLSKERQYYLHICLAIIVYSALIEVAQSFVPGRMMSFGDLVANTAGVAIGGFLVTRLARFRFS